MNEPSVGEAKIREARGDDAGMLARIAAAAVELHAGLDPEFYERPQAETLVPLFAEREGERSTEAATLVAEVDEGVIGFVEVRLRARPPGLRGVAFRPKRAAIIENLAVAPEARVRGIGTQLMRAAEAWAVERGAEVALVDVHAGNEDALRFYQERLGYYQRGVILSRSLTVGPGA